MKHSCSSAMLRCIDFRFVPAVKHWMEDNNLSGDSDVVAVAGSVKNLVSPGLPTDREYVLRQFDIAERLHKIQTIILMNHTDCGAYGGRPASSSREEERAMHERDLKEAARIIKEHLPQIKIKLVLADIEPTGEINFIETV